MHNEEAVNFVCIWLNKSSSRGTSKLLGWRQHNIIVNRIPWKGHSELF